MDCRRAAGALLALAVCIASTDAAPTASNQTALDLYDGATEGCYYNFQHYGEGDRIMTNEPCLNCTCHNRMLMCYLRVCPFTKPIGQDCTVEKRADQCCPIVTCPDVPVDLLTSTSTSSPAEYGATGVGKLDKYGCSIDNKYFPEGAKVPPTPNKPCEHCYCIRNMTTCVMQECTLHVDGCTPIYHKDVCCPVRYSCDHPEDEVLLLDDMTTTVRPTPGFLLTTTTVSPVTQMSQDCVHDDQIVPDGALIKTEKACEHCYCMKGDIVCVVQECGTPMENEGKNCTSQPPREGQCCPDTYICEGDEINTEFPSGMTLSTLLEDLTTLSPPRRVGATGSDYRKETEEPYTEKSPVQTEVEGSGDEQTSIPSFDISEAITTDEQGSGYERTTLPNFALTDKEDSNKIDKEYTTQPSIGVSDEVTTESQKTEYDVTTPRIIFEDKDTTEEQKTTYEHVTNVSVGDVDDNAPDKYDIHKYTSTPSVGVTEKEITEQVTEHESATTLKQSAVDETTSPKDINKFEETTLDSVSSTDDNIEKTHESDNDNTTPSTISSEDSSKKDVSEFDSTQPPKQDEKLDHEITTKPYTEESDENTEKQVGDGRTTVPSDGVFDKETQKPDVEYEPTTVSSSEVVDKEAPGKHDKIDESATPSTSVSEEDVSEKHDFDHEHATVPSSSLSHDITTEKQGEEYDNTAPPYIKTSDEITPVKQDTEFETEGTTRFSTEVSGETPPENQDIEYERTTLSITGSDTTEKEETGNERTTIPSFNKQDFGDGSTTLPSIHEFDNTVSEKQDEGDERTTPSSIKESVEPEKHDSSEESTTSSNISFTDKHISEKDYNVDGSTELPNIDDSKKGISETEPSGDESTTLASISVSDKDAEKYDHEDESTVFPSVSTSKSDTSEKQEDAVESSTLPSIDDEKKETLEKEDSGDKSTAKPIATSSEDTSDKQTNDMESTSLPSFTDFSKEPVEKHDSSDESTTLPSIDAIHEKTTEKQESDAEYTTLPSIDDSKKDTTEKEDADKYTSQSDITDKEEGGHKSTTLPSISIFDEDTADKQDQSTTPSDDDSKNYISEKEGMDDKTTTLSSISDTEKDIHEKPDSKDESTVLPDIGTKDKDTTEKEYGIDKSTEQPSVSAYDNEATEKYDHGSETTLSNIVTDEETSHGESDITTSPSIEYTTKDTAHKQDSEHKSTTLSSVDATEKESEYDRTTLPSLEDGTSTKVSEHGTPSNVDISHVDTSKTQVTDSTDESALYVTSTAKIPILEEVEITTEPDKGLNTVPSGNFDDELMIPMTTEKTALSDVKEITEAVPISEDKDHAGVDVTEKDDNINYVTSSDNLLQSEKSSTQSTPSLYESTGPAEHTPISGIIYPEIDENESKVTTTESAHKLDIDVTSTDKIFIPEITTIVDKTENEVDDYSRIPGEGDCLLNSITYKNNTEVPKRNNCHSSCKCISSIIRCDPIICSPPPKYMDNCQPIYDSPESCCPTYICHSGETMPPQPDSHVSVTDQPSLIHECHGDKCDVSHDKHTPVSSEKPVIGDCGSTGCGDDIKVPVVSTPVVSDECADNKCSPQAECSSGDCKNIITVQPCEGKACNVDQDVKPVKDITSPSVSNEICDDEKDCKKQDDAKLPCVGDLCRRKDSTELQSKVPTSCSDSECDLTKHQEESSADDSKIIIPTVPTTQEEITESITETSFIEDTSKVTTSEKQTERTTIEHEVQTISPETVSVASTETLEQSTTKSEISNELTTLETETASDLEPSKITTSSPQLSSSSEKSESDYTERDSSVTEGSGQMETTVSKEIEDEEEVTKSPEIVKETVTEQSYTESPDVQYTTKLQTIDIQSNLHEPVTSPQDITVNIETETTTKHISNEVTETSELEHATTLLPLDITTLAAHKEEPETVEAYTTQKSDVSVTETKKTVEQESTTLKSEMDYESSQTTIQPDDENASKETVSATTSERIDESTLIDKKHESPTESSISTDKVSTEIYEEPHFEVTTQHFEADIQVTTTETSIQELVTQDTELPAITTKHELDAQSTELPSVTESAVKDEIISSTASHELKKTDSKLTTVPEEFTESTTKTLELLDENTEEHKDTDLVASTAVPETSETGFEFTEPVKETSEIRTTTESATEKQHTEQDERYDDNIVSSVHDGDRMQTELPLSHTVEKESSTPATVALETEVSIHETVTESDTKVDVIPDTTEINEVRTTEKSIEDHVTEAEPIPEKTIKPLTDEEKPFTDITITEYTEKPSDSPIIDKTEEIITEKQELTTQSTASHETEVISDSEITTIVPKIDDTVTEITKLPSLTLSSETDQEPENIPNKLDDQTQTTEPSHTDMQDVVTTPSSESEPETVSQSEQTERVVDDVTTTEASISEHTSSLITQVTESAEYTKESATELYTELEKLSTVSTSEKEATTTETSIHEIKDHDESKKPLEISTASPETIPEETEGEILITTQTPELHMEDKTTGAPSASSTEIHDTSTLHEEVTKSPHDIGESNEATTSVSQEMTTEIVSIDMSTKAPEEIHTKEPIELTTGQYLDKTSAMSEEILTERTPEITTETYHRITKPLEDTTTEAEAEVEKEDKETTPHKLIDMDIKYTEGTTTTPHEVTTEIIKHVTTVSDETSVKDEEITEPHVTTDKEELKPSTITDSVNVELLPEKTTESQDLLHKDSSTEKTQAPTHSLDVEDSSKSSQEPEPITELYGSTETTPYVVELEEHTHKAADEISTTISTEQESTAVLDSHEGDTTGEDIKHEEPTSTSSPSRTESAITTLFDELVEKSTLSSSSPTEEHEHQYTTSLPVTSDEKHDEEASPPAHDQESYQTSAQPESPTTDENIFVQTEKVPTTLKEEISSHETSAPVASKITTVKAEEEITTSIPTIKPEEKPAATLPPTDIQEPSKHPDILPPDDMSDDDVTFPPSDGPPSGYGPDPSDYGEEPFGPGTCRYGGKVYVSAQQIPRDDPCDFCFCFRSDIICLQQSCPPPIHGCHEEPIQGFCCPRYECPVAMATTLNVTTTTTTTTTTLPPHFLPHAYKGAAQRRGCQIKGHTYKVGELVRASSGPCLHCTCGGDGQMKCDPKACTPEPMLRQMIAAAVSAKRRR